VLQRACTDIQKPIEKIEVYLADHAREEWQPAKARRPTHHLRGAQAECTVDDHSGHDEHKARYDHGASVLGRKT
jgi:hypothetical protein